MYLAELTRNAFQSGISASKWLALCKLMIQTTPVHVEGHDETASSLSNSVLVLYRSYPGDPGLQDYLKAAIQDGILPVSTFVSTLLQAARSPELHIPATLDTLCRIALDFHYSSGQPPFGSVVPSSASATIILGTVQDALALLRTAHSLPISHFHQLITSASELVILLLSCVPDISQVPTTQALLHFSDVSELLNYSLTPDVRQVLDNFVMSLTLLIRDDVKAAREAQMMHTIQLTLGKGDILGPSSDTDIITLGLLLNYMVTHRAHEYGAGDVQHAVALLVASFRWSSWTPTVCYTQLLLSAFACLAQHGSNARLWKAFIVGRLPSLLVSFTEVIKTTDTSQNADLSGALKEGLTALFRRPDVIVEGEHAIPRDVGHESTPDEDATRSLSREFLQQLIKHSLVSPQIAAQLDPQVNNETPPKWHAEANDLGLDLTTFLESKLIQDSNLGETNLWMDRIWRDCGSHILFANIVHKRFASAVASLEVEALGQLCKILHRYDNALDMVALHKSITDLLFYSIQFLEDYDCETVGDPQTAVGHLGDVVLFVQYTLARFKFENREITRNGRTVSSAFFLNTDTVAHPRSERSQAEVTSFNAWFKALFDSSSEGIEDNILRSTNPKVLLRIAPFLFSQAIAFTVAQKMEKEVLVNGISYFTGPLLNWTLVSVIKFMIKEILQPRPFLVHTTMYYDIIQSLLLSPSCPKSVLALCSPQITVLLTDKKRPAPAAPVPNSFKVSAVRHAVANATGLKLNSDALATDLGGQIWYEQDQQAVQTAFSMARSHNPPFLDIRRCLKTLPPIKFLQLFWNELIAAASLGELEACRRIATFVLTMPQDATMPPILPIFLFVSLPSIIANADKQEPSEQMMTIELLVAVVSSVLNAAIHLEWAMRFASSNDRLVLGQSSVALARRLALDLRRDRTSSVSTIILQRLTSSTSFVANFPAFVGELGA